MSTDITPEQILAALEKCVTVVPRDSVLVINMPSKMTMETYDRLKRQLERMREATGIRALVIEGAESLGVAERQ